METKHRMIIYWSEDDDAFLVEVPELPGCMSEGRTRQEAIGNAQVIIQEWMDAAKQLGRAIPQPKFRVT